MRKNQILLLAIFLSIGLFTCKPTDPGLPGVDKIQIILSKNAQPLPFYFLEDTATRTVNFEVYYFNERGSYITVEGQPQFFANGKPFSGNSYTLTQPGKYLFTAKVNNKMSGNGIELTVFTMTEYVKSLVLKSLVPAFDADSGRHVTLAYDLVTKKGEILNALDYGTPKLKANGQLRSDARSFTTTQAGKYELEAELYGLKSNLLTLTARDPIQFPIVRLPVIFHFTKDWASPSDNPAAVLAEVNEIYRQVRRYEVPSQANAYIEFYPATHDPSGRVLSVAGLHELAVKNATALSAEESQVVVANVLHEWCPQQYINVFIGSVHWVSSYKRYTSYAHRPAIPSAASRLTCADLAKMQWAGNPPAIHLGGNIGSCCGFTMAHELGHFLGLPHTYVSECYKAPLYTDVPHHSSSAPFKNGLLYSCSDVGFRANNLMGYGSGLSITQDQVKNMRKVVDFGDYIPKTRK